MNGEKNPTAACEILRRIITGERTILGQRFELSRQEALRAPGLARYAEVVGETQQRELKTLARLGREAGCRFEELEQDYPAKEEQGEDLSTVGREARRLAEDLAGARRVAAVVERALFGEAGMIRPPGVTPRPWCGPLRQLLARAGESIGGWHELARQTDLFGPEAGDFARAAADWREQDLALLRIMVGQDCGEVAVDGEPARNGKPARPPAL